MVFVIELRTRHLKHERSLHILRFDHPAKHWSNHPPQIFLRGASGVLLGYDITSRASFEGIRDYVQLMKDYAEEGTRLVIVGHKLDLEEEREVSTEEGHELARAMASELGGRHVPFYETSAKTGENVEAALSELVKQCPRMPEVKREWAVCRMLGEVNGRSGFEATFSEMFWTSTSRNPSL